MDVNAKRATPLHAERMNDEAKWRRHPLLFSFFVQGQLQTEAQQLMGDSVVVVTASELHLPA